MPESGPQGAESDGGGQWGHGGAILRLARRRRSVFGPLSIFVGMGARPTRTAERKLASSGCH